MKERPILFSAPMVRAILDGSKTQTRRVAKGVAAVHSVTGEPLAKLDSAGPRVSCPYGQPGDRLWVRETWAYHVQAIGSVTDEDGPWVYAADGSFALQSRLCDRWRPSIHMPRAASRITLEITGARVERLIDISEADAVAEGCTKNHNGYFWGGPHAVSGLKQMATAKSAYKDLWESINGPDSWAANPWVWVVEFKRI